MPPKPHETALAQEDWNSYWDLLTESCRRVTSYLEGSDFEHFRRDPLLHDAVVRNLEVIADAADMLPQEARSRIEAAHWRRIGAYRAAVSDSLWHDNHERVWQAAHDHLPDLLDALEAAQPGEGVDSAADEADPMGRRALWPHQIPWAGWRQIAGRLWPQMVADNVFIVTAGLAFYGLLAIFPALAALVAAYGLLFDPEDVRQQLSALGGLLPSQAWRIIEEQLTRITGNTDTSLSLSAAVGALITLWSARAGIGALMVAMNIVFGEQEDRSIVRWYALSLLLTVGAIVYGVVAMALVVAAPALLDVMGIGGESWVPMLRWPLLAVSTMAALSIIYRYGPSRRPARWPWVTWGAILATLTWLMGSALFSYYIANFANYDETYGSVGAVVILMMWFYVTGLVVLVGAELDALAEQQTHADSTIGPARPMGQRGAYVADTAGPDP